MRLGLSPVPLQLGGTRGSPLAPECSALLQISIRSSADGGVIEAIAPNYFQPLLKIFCAIWESSGVRSLCMLTGGDLMPRIKRQRAAWCWRLGSRWGGWGDGGCHEVLGQCGGFPSTAPRAQHQHSTWTAPIPSYFDNKNGCKTGIFGCLPFLPFSERPETRLEKRRVSR